jgi:hypothetical protein
MCCEAQTGVRHGQSTVDLLEKDIFINIVETFGRFEWGEDTRTHGAFRGLIFEELLFEKDVVGIN